MGRPKLIKVDVTDGRGLGGAKKKTVTVQAGKSTTVDFTFKNQ